MDKSQSDPGRPLVVIADREEARGEDVSFVSIFVPFYRRRFALAALWLALVAPSIVVFPSPSASRRWFFSVSFEPAPEINDRSQLQLHVQVQAQGQAQGLEGVAGLLSGMSSNIVAGEQITVEWSRLGSGSKAELLRQQLNVSAQSAGEDVPVAVGALHAAAHVWAAEQAAAWSSLRAATESALLLRADSLIVDATATMQERQAAETALAEVRAAAAAPPRWKVSEIGSTPVSPAGTGRTWALRVSASCVAAVAVVGALIGWSAIASASRHQPAA